MVSAVSPAVVRTGGMSKKKPTGGKHKTPRINVGVPEEWHAVLRKLAAKRQQPVLYTLISLVEQEATKVGIEDVPSPPWDEESDE
jgi:hypothetical protein